MIELLNCDCMEYMSTLPDKAFDLAIVDPPYGINIAKENPRVSGRWNYIPKQWDSAIPDDAYFSDLRRVSNHQIIWGGNYFACLGASRGFIIWDKDYDSACKRFEQHKAQGSLFAPSLEQETQPTQQSLL